MNDKSALYKSKAPGAVPQMASLDSMMGHGDHSGPSEAHTPLTAMMKHGSVPTQGDKNNTKKRKLGNMMGQ